MLDRLSAGYRHRVRALTALAADVGAPGDLVASAVERSERVGLMLEQALLEEYGQAREATRQALAARGISLRTAWRARTERSGGWLAEPVCFACDGSLGGLARWLRAAGYRARWLGAARALEHVAQAVRRGEVLLITDSRVLGLGAIRDGRLATLWLPSSLTRRMQLALVLGDLDLPLGAPRCMECGGNLAAVEKDAVRSRIPPRTALWRDTYSVCADCGRLYWEGTHWERIRAELQEAARLARPGSDRSPA